MNNKADPLQPGRDVTLSTGQIVRAFPVRWNETEKLRDLLAPAWEAMRGLQMPSSLDEAVQTLPKALPAIAQKLMQSSRPLLDSLTQPALSEVNPGFGDGIKVAIAVIEENLAQLEALRPFVESLMAWASQKAGQPITWQTVLGYLSPSGLTGSTSANGSEPDGPEAIAA